MKILVILISLICLSCATRNLKYDQYKIRKKYSSNYNLYADSSKIDFDKYFFDKNNIQNVLLDKKSRTITINRFQNKEFKSINNLGLDTLNNWEHGKIVLYVINGVPHDKDMIDDLLFEVGAIKFAKILLGEDLSKSGMHWEKGRNLMIITAE